jgi:hypothetical protein
MTACEATQKQGDHDLPGPGQGQAPARPACHTWVLASAHHGMGPRGHASPR